MDNEFITVQNQPDRETAETVILHVMVEDDNAINQPGAKSQTATGTSLIHCLNL